MADTTKLPPLQKPPSNYWAQQKSNVWKPPPKPPPSPKPPPRPQQYVENQWESFDKLGKDTIKQLGDNTKAAGKDILKQLGADFLLKNNKAKSVDMQPNQEFVLPKQGEKQEKKAAAPRAETNINYFREIAEAGKLSVQKENAELKNQIQNLVVEIQQMARVVKPLESAATQATTGAMVKPGKYHKTFFQHLTSVFRDARKRVDSSGSWLSATKGKNRKKKSDWWGMAAQHGTQFMMNSESNSSRGAG